MLVLIKERVYLRQEYLLCEGRMRGKAKSRNRNFRKGWKRKLTHLLTYIFVIPSFRIYTWKKKKNQITEFSSTLPPAPHKLQWNVSHIQVSGHMQGWLWHLDMRSYRGYGACSWMCQWTQPVGQGHHLPRHHQPCPQCGTSYAISNGCKLGGGGVAHVVTNSETTSASA